MRRLLALPLFLLVGCVTAAPVKTEIERGFLLRSLAAGGATYPYTVYVPRDYDGTKEWPAILFLHGAGERGDDGLLQTAVGLPDAIRRNPERWPAIGIFPQAPLGRQWAGDAEGIALAALEAAGREVRIDSDRVYLTGMSMGGAGTWSLASQNPNRFAAIVPVCAWVDPKDGTEWDRDLRVSGWDAENPYASLASRLARVPVWIWHGSDDKAVAVEESRRMSAALEHARGNARYTELPGVGHNAWDPAYRSEELPLWLFAQRR